MLQHMACRDAYGMQRHTYTYIYETSPVHTVDHKKSPVSLFIVCACHMLCFCKRILWKRRYSAKATYNFKEFTTYIMANVSLRAYACVHTSRLYLYVCVFYTNIRTFGILKFIPNSQIYVHLAYAYGVATISRLPKIFFSPPPHPPPYKKEGGGGV